jgi:hypothetical protein
MSHVRAHARAKRDFGAPQPTEWQRVRNQIDAAMIFARADFVNAHEILCCQVENAFMTQIL